MNPFDAVVIDCLSGMETSLSAWVARILPPPGARLDADDSHEPDPMDTLGSLIDKLCTVNLKMWHNQEALYAIRRMSAEEFQECHGHDLEGLRKLIARACDLNVQRSRLMDAIDRHFASVTSGETKAVVAEQHKTY